MKIIKIAGAILICLLAIIGAVSVVAFLKKEKPTDISQYEHKIIMLKHECDSLKTVAERLQFDKNGYFALTDSLQMIIEENTVELNDIKRKYGKEINRVNNFSYCEHLRFFTSYIESN